MRAAAVAVICALFTTISTTLASPAQAASWMKIDAIYYDPPGKDTTSNTQLNAEFIRIRNTDTIAHTLTGWTVRDAANHVYTFPTTTIKAGSTVILRTGTGTDGISTRYWQHAWYVWNNGGDTAYLRGPSGTLIDTCQYPGGGISVAC